MDGCILSLMDSLVYTRHLTYLLGCVYKYMCVTAQLEVRGKLYTVIFHYLVSPRDQILKSPKLDDKYPCLISHHANP